MSPGVPFLQHTRSSRCSCPRLASTLTPLHNSVFAVPVLTCPRSGSGTQSQRLNLAAAPPWVSSLTRWWPLTLPASRPALRAAPHTALPRGASLAPCVASTFPSAGAGEPRGTQPIREFSPRSALSPPTPSVPPAHTIQTCLPRLTPLPPTLPPSAPAFPLLAPPPAPPPTPSPPVTS